MLRRKFEHGRELRSFGANPNLYCIYMCYSNLFLPLWSEMEIKISNLCMKRRDNELVRFFDDEEILQRQVSRMRKYLNKPEVKQLHGL